MIVTTMMWLTIIQRREESRDSVASVIRVMKTQKSFHLVCAKEVLAGFIKLAYRSLNNASLCKFSI